MMKHENTKNGMLMSKQVLDGIKILDFGWALVGSITTKQLADYGAKVVRVESMNRICLTRTNRMVAMSKPNDPDDKPWFLHLNTSKYSMYLNLKSKSSRYVMDRLIKWADVINSNFVPGTLEKLGYGYDYVKQLNPQVIMVMGSAYGQTGPMAREWGVDGTGAALSGYLDLTGWPDRGPLGPNVPYGDIVLPFIISTAIMAALEYRRRTGQGQFIDASMLEVCAHQITPAMLQWQIKKELQKRNGNRVPYAAPHGVFPCLGDDRWCAIAVTTEEEWQAFCRTIGFPELADNPKFRTLKDRKSNEDELEEIVSAWTKKHKAEDVMQILQDAGVPAGVVQNAADVMQDPQLKSRDFLIPMEHPVIGKCLHPTPPFKLQKTPAQIRTSPCMGEHTEQVCIGYLGMTDEEFVKLCQCDVFQ